MAYASWSVVFGEQPSASKWNILGTNDASFHDGTGIDDDAILTRHILDDNITTPKILNANVTSLKLAQAFFRGLHQDGAGTSTAPTGLTVQFGWNFIQGSAADEVTKGIAFPSAFASAPLSVYITCLGLINSSPSAITDFTSETGSGPVSATASDIGTSSFLAQIARSDAVATGASNYYGFSWMAIGTV